MAGFLYYDARADDARLTLAVLRTAALDHGAVAANYAPVGGLRHRRPGAGRRGPGPPGRAGRPGPGDGADGPEFDDPGHGGGERHRGVGRRRARPRRGAHPHSLRPAKGVHVTVPAAKLPGRHRRRASRCPSDRRSIFVVPWPEGDHVYLGTTDTAYDGPLDDPRLHARGRRLPPRRGQRRHHLGRSPAAT